MVQARLQNQLFALFMSAIAVVHAAPVSTDGCSATGDPVSICNAASLSLAVLGDSWASGVAYNGKNVYDGNKDNCLRITEAYGAQLAANQSWFQQGTTLSFDFLACSGSRLVDIVKGRKQMSNLQPQTDVLVMTVGGNNAEFFSIASNCIYHQTLESETFSYGNPYENDPDRSGLCAQAIDKSRRYIRDGDFETDVTNTIHDMLIQTVVQDNPNMRIYYTGYAEFFNLDDDWCDNESFSVFPSQIPGSNRAFLSHILRSDMNGLTNDLNNIIQAVITNLAKPNVKYLSIDESFEGHRFCEKGSNGFNEYYDSNVWFWNLTPPDLTSGTANTTTKFDNQEQELAAIGANGTTTIPKTLNLGQAEAIPLFLDDDNTDHSALSGNGTLVSGWQMRPFHPKLAGHAAIKDAIITQLKADKVPGVKL